MLELVFLRARRELKFFPRIAELIEMAEPPRKELLAGGATKAWAEIQNFLSRWGVDRNRHSVYGPAPKLDPRTEFAIRCVGGLYRINRCSDSEYGFIQRTFEDAWQSYDVTKHFELGDLARLLDGAEQRKLTE